ncbi:MAG: hypothetical protein H0X39_00240 [Actinobacteria bacterium]|nr:hypothetical protein [Actinomycetota bacterium]
MANTFIDLYSEVAAAGPFSTTAQSAGRVKLWTNQAQNWFLNEHLWSFLESRTTVASANGSADYVLVGTSPIVTDFWQMIDVAHNQANAGTTFIKLRFLNQQDFDEITAITGPVAGIPRFYTVRGGTAQTTPATILPGGNQALSVWPVPNFIGSFKIGYFRSADSVQMTADTDVPIVPIRWQQAVILNAVGRGLMLSGSSSNSQAMSQAQANMALASEIVARAITQDSVARGLDYPPGERPIVPPQLPPGTPGISPAVSQYGMDRG